jgi:serine/threonine-protein kinase PpkA
MIQIPGYTIIRELGRGGMATVYLARQDRLGRQVALKVMQPQATAADDFTTRFMKEGRIVARLQHPQIVTIYDLDTVGDVYYFSMEFLPNGTLADQITRGLSTHRAVDITRQIARALSVAHDQGVIHRDVKPQNILFRADGTPVLTDFGIARAAGGGAEATHLTAFGMVIGSPRYMSPEQSTSKPIDARSDLYSLGVVFYEMLTGELPYTADDVVSLAMKHCTAPIPRLPESLARFQPILDKLLAKDPGDRFGSGQELIEALDALATGRAPSRAAGEEETRVQRPGRRRTGPAAPPTAPRRASRTGLWVVALALAVLIAAGSFFLFIQQPEDALDEFTAGLPAADRKRSEVTERYETLALEHLRDGELSQSLELIELALRGDADDRRLRAIKSRVMDYIEADKLLREAESRLGERAFDESLSLIADGLELVPGHPGLGELRSRVVQEKTRHDRAQALRFLERAEAAFGRGALADSMELTLRGLSLDPDNARLRMLETRLQQELERQRALRELIGRVSSALAEGRLTEARRDVDKGLAQAPSDQQLLDLRAEVARRIESERSERAAKLLGEAKRRLDDKEFDASLALIRQGLELVPQHPGLVALNKRVPEERARHLADRASELVQQARSAFDRGELVTGLRLADEALSLSPNHEQALTVKTEIEDQLARRQALSGVIEQATQLADQGQLAEALAVVDRALTSVPESAELQGLQARIREGIAREKSEKAAALRQQAKALTEAGRFEDALQALARALELQPQDEGLEAERDRVLGLQAKSRAQALLTEAQEALAEGRHAAAMDLAQRGLDAQPGHEGLTKLRALIQSRIDETETVRQAVDEARGFLSSQDFDQGLRSLAAALRLFPKNAELLGLRSQVLEQKRQAEAERVREWAARASELLKVGDYEAALALIRQALALKPQDPTVIGLQEQILARRSLEAQVGRQLQVCEEKLAPKGAGGPPAERIGALGGAAACYRGVLALQAGQETAVARLDAVRQQLAEAFSRAIEDLDPETARGAVETIATSDPDHPELEEMKRRLSRFSKLVPPMVALEGGCFQMGSPRSEANREADERPHRACVDGFFLAKFETRVSDFRRFVEAERFETDAEKGVGGVKGCWALDLDDEDKPWDYHSWAAWRTPNKYQQARPDEPVSCVSKRDAEAYIRWLNRETGQRFRLPTEAEWEYAARGGTATTRFWGNGAREAACRSANVADTGHDWSDGFPCDDGYEWTSPAGQFAPNPYGLHDMLGNVLEWTCSEYDARYGGLETTCAKAGSDAPAVMRGGAWNSGPAAVRAAYRDRNYPESRYSFVGFRIAHDDAAADESVPKEGVSPGEGPTPR